VPSRFASAALVLVAACGGDPEPLLPADYATTFVEVRDCRRSSDHDLRQIRIVADPAAAAVYGARTGDFAPGALLVKEEYDFADGDCAGPILQWTVMQRDAAATAALGWQWQRIDPDRTVVTENDSRCINCHTSCGVPPDGFLGTCAVP
jgi:hypothetical protein